MQGEVAKYSAKNLRLIVGLIGQSGTGPIF